MAKIPKFKSEAEERAFWETHDSTEYWDDTEEAPSFELSEELSTQIQGRRQKKRLLTMQIGQREIDVAKAIAQEKGIGYQTLMRMWIIEGIQREQNRNESSSSSHSLPGLNMRL